MRVVVCAQNSPEWEAARLGLCTASSFCDVLSKSRTKGEESTSRRNLRVRLVLERLTGRKAGGGFDSAATRAGHEREPDARLAFEVATGVLVEQVGFCRHDSLEAGASPDFLTDDGGGEIKCPQPSAHLQTLRTRRVPPEYMAQVMGAMWICERRRWSFISYSPDFPERLQLVIVPVERDQPYIDRLAADVEVFMDEVRAEQAELERIE